MITLRSKKTFESVFRRAWKSELFNSSDDIAFYSNGKFLAEQRGYSQVYFTMRLAFDDYLLHLAQEAGAFLKTGQAIKEVELTQKFIVLQSGERIAFEFLIGADGVNSLVAKTLFGNSFDPETIGFGLEVEVPREMLAQRSDTVEIEFSAARWRYGWVFPKQRSFTIGVGGIHRLNPDLRAELERYLQSKGLKTHEFKVKGQYIPFGDFRKVPGADVVLLCGDAAGTVDPITGEGIAYAMQTGAAPASAILEATSGSGRGEALEIYLKEYKLISSSLRQAKFWRCLIFPTFSQGLFAWAFSDAGTLQRGYLDILAGTRDYSVLYWLFIIQAGKAIRKPFARLQGKLFGHSPSTNNLAVSREE